MTDHDAGEETAEERRRRFGLDAASRAERAAIAEAAARDDLEHAARPGSLAARLRW